jgi:hypothetical protein
MLLRKLLSLRPMYVRHRPTSLALYKLDFDAPFYLNRKRSMQTNAISRAGFFGLRNIIAFNLCVVGALLGIASTAGGAEKCDRDQDSFVCQNLRDYNRAEDRRHQHGRLFVAGGHLLVDAAFELLFELLRRSRHRD